jgi:hypothetical protein
MKKIIVAHGHTSIEVLHSLIPLILCSKEKENWDWKFVDYKISNIFKKQGDLLILVRKYHDGKTTKDNIIFELLSLRKNFTKIIYFDDSASPSSVLFFTFPYVDKYWKRSRLVDMSLYKKNFYGGRLFSHYYHSEFGINDQDLKLINIAADSTTDLSKLKIAWNIGVGVFPLNGKTLLDKYYPLMRKFITTMTLLPSVSLIYLLLSRYIKSMRQELKKEINLNKRIFKLSARFSSLNYTNSIGFQRSLLLKKIQKKEKFLTGNKSKREFTKETYEIFGLISPFGWGEMCYRDFEAALGGAYLIKPDMSHLVTWPNIYAKHMYHSLSWDCSNLDSLEFLFDRANDCGKAVNETRNVYRSSLNEIIPRCIDMIDEVM